MVSEKALDDYEVAVRARVDQLQGEFDRLALELAGVREVLSQVEITRATLSAVAASQTTTTRASAAEALCSPGVAIDRSQKVPVWRADLTASALPEHYRPVYALLLEAAEPVRCQQLAAALGFEAVSAKVEGVRSKLKRLVARGWAVEQAPGLFAVRV
jgi:hypothetical protein